MSGWTRRINNRMPVVVAALLMASVGHNAVAQMATETPATTLTETDQPVACADFAPDTGIRFDLAGFCAKWSGSLQGIYQNDLSTTGSAPAWFMGVVHSSNQQNVYTFNATTSLAAKRQTPLGLLDSNLTLQWQKPSNDGTYAGAATVLELRASLAGATVGYTRSLMDFWWEDFLFLAASTDRAAGIVSYEHRVIDGLNLAVAIESGLPASQQDTEGLRSISFNSPLLTAHLLYTTPDNQSFQLAGVLRQANDQTNPVLASRASTTSTRTGCALSAGATVPTTFTGAEDYVSGQVVYAVDASYFLGTKVDLSALSSILPYTPPTRGWSAVASFHHQWSERWESNVFVSYLSLDAELMAATSTVRTARYDANLYWRPIRSLRFGVELGGVKTEIAANGPLKLLTGVSGQALVGYLSAQWKF